MLLEQELLPADRRGSSCGNDPCLYQMGDDSHLLGGSHLPSDIRSARAGGPGDHARADRSGSGECTDSEWNFVSRACLSMQRDDPVDHPE